eukprot:m.190102 g.190102  ORF g.190102 m.190102 type:complete len:54 (-) comp16751_c0_seq3:4099-4260(-)
MTTGQIDVGLCILVTPEQKHLTCKTFGRTSVLHPLTLQHLTSNGHPNTRYVRH